MKGHASCIDHVPSGRDEGVLGKMVEKNTFVWAAKLYDGFRGVLIVGDSVEFSEGWRLEKAPRAWNSRNNLCTLLICGASTKVAVEVLVGFPMSVFGVPKVIQVNDFVTHPRAKKE
ncbi:uncharacterized protein [Physcomitrium patens]|uniref:uncharacterized protein n=1 Tax=Physcomitrium patens TaxID=3218 RepID=UPI003CCDDB82